MIKFQVELNAQINICHKCFLLLFAVAELHGMTNSSSAANFPANSINYLLCSAVLSCYILAAGWADRDAGSFL